MNAFQTAQKKLKNKKGFTLMEMLIVVAIVAILVAIAFPTFTGALDRAREATDEANMRAAKGVAAAMWLTEAADGSTAAPAKDSWFDANTGKFVASSSKPSGYGKSSSNKNKVIRITGITSDGTYSFNWQ